MTRIALIGGPHDGVALDIHADTPPPRWRMPIEPSFSLARYAPISLQTAEYDLTLDHGMPSRADDGAYRYSYAYTADPIPDGKPPAPALGQCDATLHHIYGVAVCDRPAGHDDQHGAWCPHCLEDGYDDRLWWDHDGERWGERSEP